MRACVKGKESVVRTLLDAGASINAKSTSGMTPLAYAVLWNRKSVVRLLLDRGARVNIRNSHIKRALNMSSNNNIKRMVLVPRGVVGVLARREVTGRR
jgi:ankyrin repeat protein